LNLKATFQSGSPHFGFTRWKQARFQLGFDRVKLRRPTMCCRVLVMMVMDCLSISCHKGHPEQGLGFYMVLGFLWLRV
jgi:hypothetical protein